MDTDLLLYTFTDILYILSVEKRLEKIKNDNQEIIDNYNTICEELGKLFGQQDVDLDRMANQYSFDEMKNDSLFTYVIELYSQEEEIIREIKAIEVRVVWPILLPEGTL